MAPDPGNSRQLTVLVAEDESPVRHLVSILMQQEGYLVLSASDGHEGLELARQYSQSIDLVITDFEMPRVNGIELCARLAAERPGIKVLLMSGSDEKLINHDGDLPFLPKPFDCQRLKERVRAILNDRPDGHYLR
jgi:DNA-binding response OmpR family regulator